MPQTNVSSCVLSIIASFSSGLDVFKKLRDTCNGQRRKIKKNGRPLTDEEVKLAKSLRQGPEDIGREYQRSVQVLGDGFAIGDAIAQTSLAEVLLKLNTGLVNIIHTFLSHGARDTQLDCQTLTVLSDKSRIDTCRTLRQLYRRMLHLRPPPTQAFSEHETSVASDKSRTSAHDATKRKKPPTGAKPTKVRAPMIARVVVQNSARPSQIALVKPGERKKKASRPSASSRSLSASSSNLAKPTSSPHLVNSMEESSPNLANPPSRTVSAESHIKRNFTSLDVTVVPNLPKPDFHRATHSASDLNHITGAEYKALSPTPLSAPPTARPEPRRRKQTPTYYSIASGSTRLGEIPLHKWSEPYDFDAMSMLNRQAARKGWPFEDPRAPDIVKKKRFGIFRLFRKNDTQE